MRSPLGIPRDQGLQYSDGPGLCLVGDWQCGTRQSLIILEGAHNLPSRAVQSSEARPTTTNSYVVRICLHTYTCLYRTNTFFFDDLIELYRSNWIMGLPLDHSSKYFWNSHSQANLKWQVSRIFWNYEFECCFYIHRRGQFHEKKYRRFVVSKFVKLYDELIISCKNDEAFLKFGVLACRFDTSYRLCSRSVDSFLNPGGSLSPDLTANYTSVAHTRPGDGESHKLQ